MLGSFLAISSKYAERFLMPNKDRRRIGECRRWLPAEKVGQKTVKPRIITDSLDFNQLAHRPALKLARHSAVTQPRPHFTSVQALATQTYSVLLPPLVPEEFRKRLPVLQDPDGADEPVSINW